ncbi:MAG: hypothetical protein UZ14_CFX002002118 [Chloroflexi bacterium OLB14]|nr:MAG: hypothetical protein UZ14_CFX002002118 [Chloroflexi bacterium OLB14]
MTDQIHQQDFEEIEAHLAGTLKRVSAPQDLIQRLHSRIQIPSRREIQLRFSDWRRLFFVFGGVLSGMLVLVTLARALYYFAGRKSTL